MTQATASRPYQLPEPYSPVARRLQDYEGGEQFPLFLALETNTIGRSVQMDTFYQQLIGRIIATKNPDAQLNLINAVATYLVRKKSLATMETRSRTTSKNPLHDAYGDLTLNSVLHNFGEVQIGSFSGDFSRRVDSVMGALKIPISAGAGFGPEAINLAAQASIFGRWANDAILSFNKYRNNFDGFAPVVDSNSFYTTGFNIEFSSWSINDGSDIEVEVGENIFLVNSSVGHDLVIWLKDGFPIPEVPPELRVEIWAIQDAQVEDSGVYQAVLLNTDSSRDTNGPAFNLVVTA